MTKTVHFHDLWCTVVLTAERTQSDDPPCSATFNVYVIVGLEDGCDKHTYQMASGAITEEVELAERYISGHVKWDGCANFAFYPDSNTMVHTCGRQQATNIGTILECVYDLAHNMLAERAGCVEECWD